jgi:hypothetical protein
MRGLGLLVLGATLAAIALSRPPEERVFAANTSAIASVAPSSSPSLVVVRRRGGLPRSWIARLRHTHTVAALAETSRTALLLRRSTTATGRVIDAAPARLAIPLDAQVVDPRAYRRVTGNPIFRQLRRGRVLLSVTSARLRRLAVGARMILADGRTVRVAGIVADGVAHSAEIVAAAADVPRARRRQTAVVIASDDPGAVARAVPDDRMTRVAALDPDASALSAGNVIRQVAVKQRFGEFAVRLPYGDDWIELDPAWQRRNVVTRNVPILGAVTCHRRMIAPLRRALGRLKRQRLARLIDRRDYAGCFAARRIPDTGALSLHAWGLAVDINASKNPQGSEPRQDRRVVRAFEREGFTWGGRWPTAPDGMHFELHGDGG